MVTVVDARVELPVFTKLAEVKFPETVVDPEFNEVTFEFPATIFPRVVEANVDDAETLKF